METWLAIASRREAREYGPDPLEPDVERRILDAGRIAGSSRNTQPWTFVVLRGASAREQAAGAVWQPANVTRAALVVAIVVAGRGRVDFDSGRAAQNMLLAAHDAGVGGCPNGVSDADAMAELLGLSEGEKVSVVLTFGRPSRPRDPARRSPREWLERADRRTLDDVVRVVD